MPIRSRAPGEADLTAHVDFEALAQSAESIGARITGRSRSATFCSGSASSSAPATLKAQRPATRRWRSTALSRLTASGAHGMGELFKAIAIADPKLGALPGFETPP